MATRLESLGALKKSKVNKEVGWASQSSLINQKQQNYSSPFLTPAAGSSFSSTAWVGAAREGIIRKGRDQKIITAW